MDIHLRFQSALSKFRCNSFGLCLDTVYEREDFVYSVKIIISLLLEISFMHYLYVNNMRI